MRPRWRDIVSTFYVLGEVCPLSDEASRGAAANTMRSYRTFFGQDRCAREYVDHLGDRDRHPAGELAVHGRGTRPCSMRHFAADRARARRLFPSAAERVLESAAGAVRQIAVGLVNPVLRGG